ncbi:MAG TPA: GapR family DNA-binding domain-containing protein [Sphingomonas sp.]|nr:GapR family DNA-binding domain-containing protein [Sphingomonas sp.]
MFSTDNVSAEQLRLFIERVERLEEERRSIADEIKDVYGEAKSTGFHAPTMRKILGLRKMEKHHRDEADAMMETYRNALGLN